MSPSEHGELNQQVLDLLSKCFIKEFAVSLDKIQEEVEKKLKQNYKSY